ncbi:AraC family transcriptional regulator [Halarcobacter bivalviorum]|uniref:AraC family transcriptional regulator n=2 Tax=Halarcobacter bivalviorum TaxID=663364 RepID=A0AAX2AC52_9BACT|nr:transcriptional regulator, AraC family [Halarcobacter bivalviorum]RXK10888.1 AraC family transcriptional regulator [Halarcobacter bivalviorum]
MKTQIFKSSKLNFLELRYIEKITQCQKMHLHEELTITAIKKGSLNIIFNEGKKLLKPKELIVINDHISHCATLNEVSEHGYVLYINKEYLKALEIFYDKDFEHIFSEKVYRKFISLCKILLDEKASLIFKEECFLEFCIDTFHKEEAQKCEENDNLAFKIKEYLDKNYLEELTLEEMSETFNLSTIHLIRVFKKEFGLPIHSYILNKKVHYAKELLASNLSIVEVALQSGFFDQSHLSRSFKRVFQLSPKEFQKSIFA